MSMGKGRKEKKREDMRKENEGRYGGKIMS